MRAPLHLPSASPSMHVSPCASPMHLQGRYLPMHDPLHLPSTPPACPPNKSKRVLPSSRLPSLNPLSSQGLFGFTIVNAATNCNSGSTWSATGLTPCTACSTCMESGVTSLCNRNTDAVCSTAVPQRRAATVTLTLVAAGIVSDYGETRKTNLQIQFALAAGVRAASTLSFPTHPPTSSPLPRLFYPLHLSAPPHTSPHLPPIRSPRPLSLCKSLPAP